MPSSDHASPARLDQQQAVQGSSPHRPVPLRRFRCRRAAVPRRQRPAETARRQPSDHSAGHRLDRSETPAAGYCQIGRRAPRIGPHRHGRPSHPSRPATIDPPLPTGSPTGQQRSSPAAVAATRLSRGTACGASRRRSTARGPFSGRWPNITETGSRRPSGLPSATRS